MSQPSQPDASYADPEAPTRVAQAAPAVRVERLTFGYRPDRPVISALDAALHAGRLTVLLGPNATGKTTLLRLMLGQLAPDAGRVLLGDQDVAQLAPAARARRLAYVAQESPVAFGFTARQVVAMGRYAQAEDDGASVAAALRDCDLSDVADRPFNELSGGQRQRVAVARALAQSGWGGDGGIAAAGGAARVILMDEPVASADLRHAHHTLGLLRDAARRGWAVLVVLHDLNLAARFADEAWVMDGGRLAYAGDWSAALTPQRLGPIYGATLTPLRASPGDRPVFSAHVPPRGARGG